jgi:hypothetical protein
VSRFKIYLWVAGIVFMIATVAIAQWCDAPSDQQDGGRLLRLAGESQGSAFVLK